MKSLTRMYFVEYFCPVKENMLFRLDQQKEMKKFGYKLTREDFLSNGGYADSFDVSRDYESKDQAYKFAKLISKKTNDIALVKSGWYSENDFGGMELEDIDEMFCTEFLKGMQV